MKFIATFDNTENATGIESQYSKTNFIMNYANRPMTLEQIKTMRDTNKNYQQRRRHDRKK
jgi:hypothetical protein